MSYPEEINSLFEWSRDRIRTLRKRRLLYKKYCYDRWEAEDWHGVQDAGSDLREIDAELKLLEWVEETDIQWDE